MSAANAKRPVFHPDLGKMLSDLRNDRGWSVQQAVNASKKGPGALTWNVLTRLEAGQTQWPDVNSLRAVADLYSLKFPDLAGAYFSANYGRDLIRHGGTEGSTLPSKGASDEPTAARVHQLETRIKVYKAIIRKSRKLAAAIEVLTSRGEEDVDAVRTGTGRRRSH